MWTTPTNMAHRAMTSARDAMDSIGRQRMKTPMASAMTPRSTSAHLARRYADRMRSAAMATSLMPGTYGRVPARARPTGELCAVCLADAPWQPIGVEARLGQRREPRQHPVPLEDGRVDTEADPWIPPFDPVQGRARDQYLIGRTGHWDTAPQAELPEP